MVWTPRQSRMLGTSDGSDVTTAIAAQGKRIWTQQPQGTAQIDLNNPAIQGLYLFLTTGMGSLMDTPLGGVNNGLSHGPKGHGKKITPSGIFTTTAGGWYGDSCDKRPGGVSTGSTGLYLFCLFHCIGSVSKKVLFSKGVGSQNDGTITLNSNGSISVTANGDYSYTSGAGIVGDGLHLVLWGNHRSLARQELWADGKLITTGASSGHQGFDTGCLDSGYLASGDVSIAYAGMGCGSNYGQRAQSLYANPWQIFAPKSSPIWVPV